MSKRAFIKRFLSSLMAFAFGASCYGEKDRPNILFIFADDHCYEAVRAHGYLDIDTPNLDRLVEKGTSFTHAYNMGAWGGAVCVASRTMLNTGQFLWRAKQANLESMVNRGEMWAQRMKRAGYRTYMTGKWHVGAPAKKIFDVTADIRGGMPKQTKEGYNRPVDRADYDRPGAWKPWEKQRGGYWAGGKHWSEVVAEHGIDFIGLAAKSNDPFFMYLAFNAPHDPRQSPKEYIDRYPLERIKVPENALPEYPYADEICGKRLRDERLAPYPRTDFSIKVNRQEYFALVTHMDDQIGRILDALEKSGKADNTYIFFTSDHGLAVGHHGLIGKQNMYDHSMRAPFIVAGPGVREGVALSTPIYLQDIMPTTLELAGVAVPEEIEFRSLLPLLNGRRKQQYKALYGAYKKKQRMVVAGDFKLIVYPTIDVVRLFNLKTDPQEMNDLAGNPEYSATIARLKTILEQQQKEYDDPLL